PQRQHRWWFVGHYDAIRQTADRLPVGFEGTGAQVDTPPTLGPAQQAKNTDKPSRSAKLFAELASKHLPELAEKVPAVAELQNLVGLAVASCLIRRQSEEQNLGGSANESSISGSSASDTAQVKSEPGR